jgi:glucose-6-phosphate isomerase
MQPSGSWKRYKQYLCQVPSLGLTLDISRMPFDDAFFAAMAPRMDRAYAAMEALEKGAMANPDEKRMVGHYWLRAPQLAPAGLGAEIAATVERIKRFAADVHAGAVKPYAAPRFTDALSIGIGGSALGPMFVADALGGADRMKIHFIDNTDPDGIARALAGLGGRLGQTLVVVTSKSGGTPETRNGAILAAEAYRAAGVDFARCAVAVTMPGSKLDRQAESEGWLARFPMFDWVGGRTSELSAVGLLPAALQGLDIDGLLAGAAACDEATRSRDTMRNPAALLALMWHAATGGRGLKDMVVIPYKDRLALFSRYLQQLVMESIGKKLDADGNVTHQGLAVYGNKGSTDQHSYVQQLRDGIDNFFLTFVRVLEAGGSGAEVMPGITAGDQLQGFLLGTREALADAGRGSITITIPRVDARAVGALIALFERAVGFYASLVNINAYNQPGVEAGKAAADGVLAFQTRLAAALSAAPQSAEQLAAALGTPEKAELAYWILEHLAANGRARMTAGGGPGEAAFTAAP